MSNQPPEEFFRLTDEQLQMLKALHESPYWQLYRRLLISIKDAEFNSILPMVDPNQVMKKAGLVAGLNIGINQLGIILAQYEAKVKKEQIAAEKKAAKPK